MTLLRREVTCAPVLAMFALTMGCGQSSFSPASPSTTSGRTTGAVISGTVSGVATTPATSSVRASTMATQPVVVTVVGTNMSTTIDGSGRFSFTGVPTGDVQLRFTGPGLDATLTVRDVQAGDRIDIKVRVTDSSVRIDAEKRDRRGDNDDDDEDDDKNDDNDDEVRGAVSGLAGACPNITFTVGGTLVRASDATRFEDGSCGRVRNSAKVEVNGRRQSDGSIRATRIELDD